MNVNILIVDDIEANLYSLESLLNNLENKEIEDINVLKTLSGEEALKIAMTTPLDLIILDVQMPIMNGFEVAKYLKSNGKTKDIPIIFLTAVFKSEEFVKQGFKAGAIDYFTKPIEKFAFLNRINLYIKMLYKHKLLEESENKLKLLNKNLKKSIEEEVEKNQKQTLQLIQQSKLAQMGEMLNMIAHQWRQPLNAMSASAINLSLKNELNILDKESIEKISAFIQKQSQNMSKIIDEFMEFNKPDTNKEFFLFEPISAVTKIISSQLTSRAITLEVDIDKEIKVYHNAKNIEHVLLNLIVNARDAFEDKNNIEEKKIKIFTTAEENSVTLTVEDNAGGIPKDIIEKVFNPYFTTKAQGKGTGIGLYMSKKMVENIGANTIDVEVINDSTLFRIKFGKIS